MRSFILVLLFVLLANHALIAATPEEESQRLRTVAAEVAARRVLREHESGTKAATDEQLAAARALILKNKETRVRAVALGPDGGYAVTFKNADLPAVAQRWGDMLGFTLRVAERLKTTRVSLSVADPSVDVFLKKLEAVLKQQGVHLVFAADGPILDTEPSDQSGTPPGPAAPSPAAERERLQLAGAEAQEQLRLITEEVDAHRIVREHGAGKKGATAEQLAAARALLLKKKETQVRAVAPGPDGGFSITLKDADMVTVAKLWREIAGFPVEVAERLKAKQVSLSVADTSVEAFHRKFETALKRQGVHLIFTLDGGTRLDSEPQGYRRR